MNKVFQLTTLLFSISCAQASDVETSPTPLNNFTPQIISSKKSNWRELFSGDAWVFMDHYFVEKNTAAVGKNIKRMFSTMVAWYIVIFATLFLEHSYANSTRHFILNCIIPAEFAAMVSMLCLQAAYGSLSTKLIYTEFIKEWPENKPYTPQVLHKAFDILYNVYQENGFWSSEYQRTFEQVKTIFINELRRNSFSTVRIAK